MSGDCSGKVAKLERKIDLRGLCNQENPCNAMKVFIWICCISKLMFGDVKIQRKKFVNKKFLLKKYFSMRHDIKKDCEDINFLTKNKISKKNFERKNFKI